MGDNIGESTDKNVQDALKSSTSRYNKRGKKSKFSICKPITCNSNNLPLKAIEYLPIFLKKFSIDHFLSQILCSFIYISNKQCYY